MFLEIYSAIISRKQVLNDLRVWFLDFYYFNWKNDNMSLFNEVQKFGNNDEIK